MNTSQCRPIRRGAFALTLAGMLFAATSLRAGANVWTGSQLGLGREATLVASHPQDPDVVYAVFQPDLYRSGNGGRSWTQVASFTHVHSLLVHPASPNVLYVGAESAGFNGVFRSSDGGETWDRNAIGGTVAALAGDPRDAFTVIAGTRTTSGRGGAGGIYKTRDGGRTWAQEASLSGAVASLVIDPRNSSVVYAGTDSGDYDYYNYSFGSFLGSSDAGDAWRYLATQDIDRVAAIAIDPADSSRVFLGLESDSNQRMRGLFRSENSGRSMSAVANGFPPRLNVTSIVFDPVDAATIYAGTSGGVYRSRDSGASWSQIGLALLDKPIKSFALSPDGRRLHAGTRDGVFDLDRVSGPIDLASGEGGGSRVLSWDADRFSVQTLDGARGWTATSREAPSANWTAIAVAGAPDGLARVLWQNGDGRSALEIVGPEGRMSVTSIPHSAGDTPTDVSVGSDGRAKLLWTTSRGAMYLVSVNADGTLTYGPPYGRYGPQYGPRAGWAAVALSDGPDERSWVLWRSMDGRFAVSIHQDAKMVATLRFAATPGFTAEDIAVGSDGRARILATSAAGAMRLWTVSADGSRSDGPEYESAGLSPRRIASGSDGLTRVLWGDAAGRGAVWVFHADGTVIATHDVPTEP